VEDVDLFSTKIVFLFTMEKASVANGSLADLRVINSTQSTEACVWFPLKFPVTVSCDKLQIFDEAVERFIFNQPKEWLSHVDCRPSAVKHDEGCIDCVGKKLAHLCWLAS